MDIDTAEAIQKLVHMIDNVNERNSLGQLALKGVMVLLASNRRQGFLSDVEVRMIDDTFDQMQDDEALERYEKVKALFETARSLWEAAEAK